ncbi:hypothetical protein H6F67_25900 [Microcoleus sp. FACHB-1515]|uniref:hypothetical protein n=1 Tax=Cyanophyceae TaxID=3028117 RepID=UPI001682663B|nr:hypothetical protein [Microcoleus sp. FACHB-1515]MBD2093283.1 hypothetical protein [Microcoleus sp. FACHB-1515]
MIYESRFWKDDLLKRAKFLRSKTVQKRWTEISSGQLEQAVMLGFYTIRKLIEAKKLSDSMVNQNIEASAYTWRGQLVTRMNWLDIDKLYNLDSPQAVTKNLLFFCHQFVHSYVFVEFFNDEHKLGGVFVSSDRERYQVLYFLEIDEIIRIFEQIGNDYPTNVVLTYSPKKQDYEVQSWVQSVDNLG